MMQNNEKRIAMSKNRIRELRNKKQLTLKELADAVGITVSALNNYQQGIREPNIETTMKLADYFGVSIAYLMGFDVPRNYMQVVGQNDDGTPYFLPGSVDAFKNNLSIELADTAVRIAGAVGYEGSITTLTTEQASNLSLVTRTLLDLYTRPKNEYDNTVIDDAIQQITKEHARYYLEFIKQQDNDDQNNPNQ